MASSVTRDNDEINYITKFRIAILNKMEAYVEELLKIYPTALIKHEDFFKKKPDQWEIQSLFHFALEKSNAKVVEKFLDFRVSINTKDETGKYPLCYAVQRHTKVIAQLFLKRGASLKVTIDDGDTILHWALKSHFTPNNNVIELLINYGADVNAKNDLIVSPLNMLLDGVENACDGDDTSCLKEIFLNGVANPHQVVSCTGKSILVHAISIEDMDLVKVLLLKGMDNHAIDIDTCSPLRNALLYYLEWSESYTKDYNQFKLSGYARLENLEFDRYIIRKYNDRYENYKQDLKYVPCRYIIRLLTQEIARQASLNIQISKDNLECINYACLKKYYELCEKEIECLKKTKMCMGYFYYDLLVANYSRLLSLCRNKSLRPPLLPGNKI